MHKLAKMIGLSALVIKELKVDPEGKDGTYVRIVGRKSGLIAWFLDLIQVDTTTKFEVFEDQIRFTKSNLSGRATTVIPLSAIGSLSSGYFKPCLYLLSGIISILLYVIGFKGIMPSVIGVSLMIYYFLHKSLLLTAISHSDEVVIAFKRSVIEGVKIEEEQAEEIIIIINKLVMAAK